MIYAHMVVRNEADRYLQSMLEWNQQWWDELHVYDDDSEDDTVEICRSYTPYVSERCKSCPPFLVNEGKFRQAAWDDFLVTMCPDPQDWVVCIDADEFLVGTIKKFGDPRKDLEFLCEYADSLGKHAIEVHVPEIWEAVTVPLVRTDGWWDKGLGTRIAKAKKGNFKEAVMGCGSTPRTSRNDTVQRIHAVSLLHYGYTIVGAAEEKYERYSANLGRHRKEHVDSIIGEPVLRPWEGMVPKVWLGRR